MGRDCVRRVGEWLALASTPGGSFHALTEANILMASVRLDVTLLSSGLAKAAARTDFI